MKDCGCHSMHHLCATSATEQCHSMAAQVKIMHYEVGSEALVSRAVVGGFRKAFPKLTMEENHVEKLKVRLAALDKKNPNVSRQDNMLLA